MKGFAATWAMVAGAALAQGEETACVPALSYLALDERVGLDSNGVPALGSYERISPDGRFVLRSHSGTRLGEVSLVELPAFDTGPLLAYRTALSNEAFPVQGSWRYLVDVDGRHFRLRDLLHQGRQAQPLFKAGMRGFYAAAAELSPLASADASLIWIRSMSWPQGDRQSQGTGPLQVRTLGVRDSGEQAKVVLDSGAQYVCAARQSEDGGVYTLPMLSVDGTEFSALPINPGVGQPSMRVYGLDARAPGLRHGCDLRLDLKTSPGKAVFAFPGQASALLAYTDNASVHFVDRRAALRDQVFRIVDERHQVLASAFPGFTKDGRLIFGASWRDCEDTSRCTARAGYVVADPYQNVDYRQELKRAGLAPDKVCVTKAQVREQRRHFSTVQGLPD